MKILVIGLDCAAPELLFGDERLVNIRQLMQLGSYGPLESVVPPITIPAWNCMATSQDPGSLGVYGFRNRSDHSYSGLEIVNSRSLRKLALWDQIAMEGGRSIIVGVPPSFPPRKVNGLSVGCFLTPEPATSEYTHPASLATRIAQLVGDYPVDVKGFRTNDKDWLKHEIYDMTRKHFIVLRDLMANEDWDYFQFVEIGLDRIHHGFWKHHDPTHVQHEPGNPYQHVIRDYYRYLDDEIGTLLELLTEDTVVLVVSDHGARPLDGGFCVNEWLVQENLLALRRYPDAVIPFGKLDVDWGRTTCWSEGGYYARIFMNVKGREPNGVVEPADYETVRNELKAKLEATTGPDGKPLGTLVFRPEDVYRAVNNIAPDLIVHFGALSWRSIGGVGYHAIHVQENDTGPDDCNHAQFGAFVLAATNSPLQGEVTGTHLLDIAPTLLELGGYDIPASMQGRPLTAGSRVPAGAALSQSEEDIIRERLSGLGYIS